jgi:hypothetical protein
LWLIDPSGKIPSLHIREPFRSQEWITGRSYEWKATMSFNDVVPGDYRLCLTLIDERTQRHVQLPIKGDRGDAVYEIGSIRIDR